MLFSSEPSNFKNEASWNLVIIIMCENMNNIQNCIHIISFLSLHPLVTFHESNGLYLFIVIFKQLSVIQKVAFYLTTIITYL